MVRLSPEEKERRERLSAAKSALRRLKAIEKQYRSQSEETSAIVELLLSANITPMSAYIDLLTLLYGERTVLPSLIAIVEEDIERLKRAPN